MFQNFGLVIGKFTILFQKITAVTITIKNYFSPKKNKVTITIIISNCNYFF